MSTVHDDDIAKTQQDLDLDHSDPSDDLTSDSSNLYTPNNTDHGSQSTHSPNSNRSLKSLFEQTETISQPVDIPETVSTEGIQHSHPRSPHNTLSNPSHSNSNILEAMSQDHIGVLSDTKSVQLSYSTVKSFPNLAASESYDAVSVIASITSSSSSPTISHSSTHDDQQQSHPSDPSHPSQQSQHIDPSTHQPTDEPYDFVDNIDDIDTIAFYGDLVGDEDTQSIAPSKDITPHAGNTTIGNPASGTAKATSSFHQETPSPQSTKQSDRHNVSSKSTSIFPSNSNNHHHIPKPSQHNNRNTIASKHQHRHQHQQQQGHDHHLSHSHDTSQQHRQHQLQQQHLAPSQSSTNHTDEAFAIPYTEEEVERLKQINSDLHILQQIFQDLNEIVLQQGEKLDVIETITGDNRALVKSTRKEIQKFANRGVRYKRRLVVGGALIGFTLVFVPSMLWLFSLPTSLAVGGLVGGGLGAYGGRTLGNFLAIRNARFGILTMIREHERMEDRIRLDRLQQERDRHNKQAHGLDDSDDNDDLDLDTLITKSQLKREQSSRDPHHGGATTTTPPDPQSQPQSSSFTGSEFYPGSRAQKKAKQYQQQQQRQQQQLLLGGIGTPSLGSQVTATTTATGVTTPDHSRLVSNTTSKQHIPKKVQQQQEKQTMKLEKEFRDLLLSSSGPHQTTIQTTTSKPTATTTASMATKMTTTTTTTASVSTNEGQIPHPHPHPSITVPNNIDTQPTHSSQHSQSHHSGFSLPPYSTLTGAISSVFTPIASAPDTVRSWAQSLGLSSRQKHRETRRLYGFP